MVRNPTQLLMLCNVRAWLGISFSLELLDALHFVLVLDSVWLGPVLMSVL